ncbi:hypothetical protein BJY04DRAFT_189596 [Aspergillus karnatakaensis]|uniref:putative histone deacetylase complex subunit (Hos4) n=1 Tax=Aspergillus karnatakaensis TaxID=1810916 RepID=UPI003CCE397F
MSDVDTVPSLPAVLDPRQHNAFAVKVNRQSTLGPAAPRRTSLPSVSRTEDAPATELDSAAADGDGPPSPKADSEAETIIQSGRESLSPEKRRKFIKHEPKRLDDGRDRGGENELPPSDVQVRKSKLVEDDLVRSDREPRPASPRWRETSPSIVKVEKFDDSQSVSSRSETTRTSRKRSFSESITGESDIGRHEHHKDSPLRSREEHILSNGVTFPRPASTDRSVSPVRQAHKRTASGPQLSNGSQHKKKKAPTPLITGFHRQSSEDRQSISSANGSPLPSAHMRKLLSADGTSASPARPTNYKKLRDQNGRTRLARACAAQELESVIARHEERPEDLNVPDNAGNTPLQIASLEGSAPIVKYLIAAGCEVETCNIDKDTPLIDAAENGHLDVVKLLLDAGANPRAVNSQGNEPSDLVPDDCDEIRLALEEAKAKPRPNRRSEETTAPPVRESSSRRISAASPRDSPPVSGARSPPYSGAAASKRKSVRSEATRNDLLWTKATPENLQAFAAKGDIAGVANILNVGQKADTESMIAAAKGGHDEVLSLLLGMGDANPDPAPVQGGSQKPGHNTPMLAAIGRGNLAVIKLFLDQPGFNPARRLYDGLTYYELSKKRRADNWEEEYDTLKEAYDNYIRTKKRKSDIPSPRRARDHQKENRRPVRRESHSPISRPRKHGSPGPREVSKDSTMAKERKGVAHPRDKSGPGIPRTRPLHDSESSRTDATKQKSLHSTKDGDFNRSDDVVKRRRLIAGRPPHDRDRKIPNIPSSDSLSGREDSIKARPDRSSEPASRNAVLKRGRSSASPERPRSRGSEAERHHRDVSKKKRRVLSEEGAPNATNGALKRSHTALADDGIKSPRQKHGAPSDLKRDRSQDPRATYVKSYDRDSVKEEREKHEPHDLTDIPMDDSRPVEKDNFQSNATAQRKSEKLEPENAEPPAPSEADKQQLSEKAERERLAEEARIAAEADKARVEKEEEERVARAARVAQEKAAEEERKRKEAEQRRIKQAEDERQKRLEQERQRLAKLRREQEEHEQRRRDALPSRLCIAANLVGSNDSQARSHSWLRKFMPVVTAETKQLDPDCGVELASERWVPNFLVAPLLATNDLQLSQYAAWEKRDVTPSQRMNLWRVTRRMLVQADDTDFLTASFGQIMQKDSETRSKYFDMEHVFWVKLSDFMDLVPHIPHLHGLDIRFLKMHIDQESAPAPFAPPQVNGVHGPPHVDAAEMLHEQGLTNGYGHSRPSTYV